MYWNRLKIFAETFLLVTIILLGKYIVSVNQWDLLSVTPLHTAIFAGSVFVIGFMLTSIHSDFKESERMPVELTTALESLHQDARLFAQTHKKFDLKGFSQIIKELLAQFEKDIHQHTYLSFQKAQQLAAFFKQMEKLKMPPNYIVKLKQDQNVVMRVILRMHYLQKIHPLPSAFILVKTLVIAMVVLLLFTNIGDLIDELAVTAFLSFMYIYLLKFIEVMDTPFHPEGSTQDDVSLFLLEEQRKRIS